MSGAGQVGTFGATGLHLGQSGGGESLANPGWCLQQGLLLEGQLIVPKLRSYS